MKPCWPEEILQAYLDGELSPVARDNVTAHLAECADCMTRVSEAEQTMMMIDGAWTNELPEVVPTARLRARIEAALTEETTPQFPLARFWNWKLAAVAAALLLALSLLFLRSPKQPSHEAQVIAPVSTPAIQITSPPNERVVAQQPLKLRKHLPRRTPARNVEETEVVTPFFPLREGEDLAALESVRLVRVELPGSALGEVGLPVPPDAATLPIKADVLLGDDGLARAIRFVR